MRHSGEIRHAMRQAASHAQPGAAWQATAMRAFTTSLMNQNTAAEIARSKEEGAQSETHDVTSVDNLLRAVRQRVRPERKTSFTMRSGVSWHESLRRSREGTRAGTPEPEPEGAPHEATPRTMADAYSEECLRFASEPRLLERYTNTGGGIRTGMLMEHLDSLAGAIAYKHMLGPVERLANEQDLPFYLVTASVDRLDVLGDLSLARDLRLSGQVIYVGRSSVEVAVRMEALNPDGTDETVLLGRFCMVCRDSKTHKAFPVNPLVLETPEDQTLWRIGEAHKNRRTTIASQSLAKVPPSSVEAEALHQLYLQSVGEAETVDLQLGSGEQIPMGSTRLEKTMLMYPQERNIHHKIFGGYLMRLAYELGYSNSMLFARGPLRFLSLDSISFARPVPIGSILRLKSYIVHTTSTKEFPVLVHVTVKASAVDIQTGKEETTNDFRFTWCREDGEPLERTVVPKTYQEAMWWIEGKRALDLGTEIRGLRSVKRLIQPEDV